MRRPALLLAIAALLAPPLPGQQPAGGGGRAIRGAVTDTAGVPLPYCNVRFVAAPASVLCDQAGRFRLAGAKAGANAIEVRRLGYIAGQFTVDVEDSVLDVTIQLSPLPTVLQPVTVRAAGGLSPSLLESGFYERMRKSTSTGTYILPEEIERLHPQHVTQLLSDRSALKMAYTGSLAVPWDRTGDCILNVFLDGLEVKDLYQGLSGQRIGVTFGSATRRQVPDRVSGLGVDGLVSPDQVAAIEIYPSGPGVPAQFQVFGSCGAIVIWTKRGPRGGADSALAGQPDWVYDLGYRSEEVFPARRGRAGMPFVEVMVGRSPQTVLFDTGDMVGLSLATPALDALNLPEAGRWNSYASDGRVVGSFRKVQAPLVLAFGRALLDHTVYEMADTSLGGLIGPDALPGSRFTLDYREEKLAVTRGPLIFPQGRGFAIVPLVRSRHPRLILAWGKVNGRPVLLEFDTGATRTVIDPALARELGLARTENGVRIDSLAIGPLVFAVASAREEAQSAIDPDLRPPIQVSVGTNVLSQILMTVDYDSGQLLIRDNRTP